MKGSIFFRLFCEIPFVFHVFLVNFSRDFGARPAKIVSVVHALCLTAVFSWGNNELKGNVKTCISGERINLEFLFAITRQLLTICLMPTALRHSTNGGDWKDAASRLASSLVNVRAIINHFTPKIDSWAAVNHLTSMTSEQVLGVIRSNYDTLTLKLQDSLDHYEKYSEKPKEAAFFTQLVRSIVIEVRRTISVSNLEQFSLLQEFATIH